MVQIVAFFQIELALNAKMHNIQGLQKAVQSILNKRAKEDYDGCTTEKSKKAF